MSAPCSMCSIPGGDLCERFTFVKYKKTVSDNNTNHNNILNRWMAKPQNHTIGARQSSKVKWGRNVCCKKRVYFHLDRHQFHNSSVQYPDLGKVIPHCFRIVLLFVVEVVCLHRIKLCIHSKLTKYPTHNPFLLKKSSKSQHLESKFRQYMRPFL